MLLWTAPNTNLIANDDSKEEFVYSGKALHMGRGTDSYSGLVLGLKRQSVRALLLSLLTVGQHRKSRRFSVTINLHIHSNQVIGRRH